MPTRSVVPLAAIFGVPYGVTGQETTVQTIPFYPHHQITNCPDDASGGLGIFGIPVVCTDPSHLSIWKTQQRFIGWDQAYDPAYVSGPTFQWAFA